MSFTIFYAILYAVYFTKYCSVRSLSPCLPSHRNSFSFGYPIAPSLSHSNFYLLPFFSQRILRDCCTLSGAHTPQIKKKNNNTYRQERRNKNVSNGSIQIIYTAGKLKTNKNLYCDIKKNYTDSYMLRNSLVNFYWYFSVAAFWPFFVPSHLCSARVAMVWALACVMGMHIAIHCNNREPPLCFVVFFLFLLFFALLFQLF